MRTLIAFFDDKYSFSDLCKLNGERITFDENDILFVGDIRVDCNHYGLERELMYHRLMVLKGFEKKIEICSRDKNELKFEKFD